MDDNKIPLKVLGLTNSAVQPSSWAVILAETDGPNKIPVVIGKAEAQAISIELSGYTPPRPLTHDLFVSTARAFGLQLSEVYIYRFEDGIFYSQLTLTDSERTVEIDSRTSDAIALALRFRAPIFTTREVVDETGMMIEIQSADEGDGSAAHIQPPRDTPVAPDIKAPSLEKYAVEELERLLQKLIDGENYEEAARVSEILNRKKGKA